MESTAIVTFRHRLIMDVYMPANRGIIMLVTILRSVTVCRPLALWFDRSFAKVL